MYVSAVMYPVSYFEKLQNTPGWLQYNPLSFVLRIRSLYALNTGVFNVNMCLFIRYNSTIIVLFF
jgi:hypothetical protein